MNNIFNFINQYRNNPMAAVMQRFNVPQGINDPDAIIQHLMNTGQVSQEQYNSVIQRAQQMGLRK